jgi:serine protease AprX
MQRIEHLELMPEPDEPSLLTTVDSDAPGYPGKAYGVSDEEAREMRWPAGPIMAVLWPWGAIVFSLTIVFLLLSWNLISPFIGHVLPDSEWAYEDTGIRELQSSGRLGSGVSVCIVDTGIDISHPDFSNIHLAGFRDFYGDEHDSVRDIGNEGHGTLMAGLLVANGTYVGAAPEVSLSIAIALGPTGKSTDERMVSQAIRWCRISQQADIISLSLGSEPGSGMGFESDTVGAVKEALEEGVFVVAAAGNTNSITSDSDVSTPASIEGVIAVGAHSRNEAVWKDSAIGAATDPYSGENRTFPNQKPEISAPGVLLWSCLSSENDPPYAYSTGTSDSTVLVTGALALILEEHRQIIAGQNDKIDPEEMTLVKVALAKSAQKIPSQQGSHDPKIGYGLLDAKAWSDQVALEFNPI